jgi:hypothetical protein
LTESLVVFTLEEMRGSKWQVELAARRRASTDISRRLENWEIFIVTGISAV